MFHTTSETLTLYYIFQAGKNIYDISRYFSRLPKTQDEESDKKVRLVAIDADNYSVRPSYANRNSIQNHLANAIESLYNICEMNAWYDISYLFETTDYKDVRFGIFQSYYNESSNISYVIVFTRSRDEKFDVTEVNGKVQNEIVWSFNDCTPEESSKILPRMRLHTEYKELFYSILARRNGYAGNVMLDWIELQSESKE